MGSATSENPRSIDLYRVPASGGPSTKLTNNPPQVDAWSPDGTKLMYNSGPQVNGVGTTSIYLINVDGTGRTLVGSGHDPDWRH